MSTEGTARSPLILADGYSYTELIPVPDSPSGFIRIFHAFFSPQEETPEPEVEASYCSARATRWFRLACRWAPSFWAPK